MDDPTRGPGVDAERIDAERTDAEEAAVRRVRELLAHHVPLALVADLTDEFPPTSAELVEAEAPSVPTARRGAGGVEPRRRA